jgi:multiple RNA-binding domain-containing protein 1
LKYTKDGKFRQFGFVGFKTEEEAKKAIEYFNETFIDASKIQVYS